MVPVLAVLVVVGVSVGGGDDGPPAASTTSTVTPVAPDPEIDDAWNERLAAVVGPIGDPLVELASEVDRWANGELDDPGLAEVLDRVEPAIRAVADGTRALDEHPGDPLALPLVQRSMELYTTSVDAHRAALALDDADLRRELDRLGRRLRILADRTFDRARERTSAPVDPGPNVELVLPAEVPEWTRLELAAGPPLEPSDTNVDDETPLAREDDRATQAEEPWLTAVEELDVPTVGDIRSAAGDAEALGQHARTLVDAVESLRTVAVPDGDRGRADRVALGWLVRADAARAGQLAAISGAAETQQLADRLLEISDDAAFGRRGG